MSEQRYEAKSFPLATEFSRVLRLVEECEAELLNAEMTLVSADWRPNMRVEAVFDDTEVVEIAIKVKPRKEKE